MKFLWQWYTRHSKAIATAGGLITSLPSITGKNVMELLSYLRDFLVGTKNLAVEGELTIPITVFVVLIGIPRFVEFIQEQRRYRREGKEAERERVTQEEQDKRDNLLSGIVGNLNCLGVYIETGQRHIIFSSYETITRSTINKFEDFRFVVPTEAEIQHENFYECWYRFLSRVKSIIEARKENNYLNLWEEYSPLNEKNNSP